MKAIFSILFTFALLVGFSAERLELSPSQGLEGIEQADCMSFDFFDVDFEVYGVDLTVVAVDLQTGSAELIEVVVKAIPKEPDRLNTGIGYDLATRNNFSVNLLFQSVITLRMITPDRGEQNPLI